jgi:hypothetical protein
MAEPSGKIFNYGFIYCSVSEFKGKKFIDIRKYYEQNGEVLPSKKGITFSLDDYTEVLKALNEYNEKILEAFK